MGKVLVHAANITDGAIDALQIKLGSLPRREIDRATAIAWMRDAHSFIPVIGGKEGAALQLVEIGDPAEHYIRVDNAPEAADALPALPAIS